MGITPPLQTIAAITCAVTLHDLHVMADRTRSSCISHRLLQSGGICHKARRQSRKGHMRHINDPSLEDGFANDRYDGADFVNEMMIAMITMMMRLLPSQMCVFLNAPQPASLQENKFAKAGI